MAFLYRRWDSLFMRLLLVQVVVVLALLVVLGWLFYAERNTTVARLYADVWAQPLAQAAGVELHANASLQVQRSNTPPEHARPLPSMMPRFTVLRERLQAHGLQVQEVQWSAPIAHMTEPGMVWFQVRSASDAVVWLGLPGAVIVPEWPGRLWLGTAVVATLMVLVSWAFTRRLTRPLEQLRQRMQSHVPGADAAPATSAMPVGMGGTPEIAGMHQAYDDLVARLEQHQRERHILLAGISHDLRSPLARIRMAAALLPDAAGSTTRQDAIVRNVAVADQLIESFLDFVRSETLVCNETVNVARIARSVAEHFEHPTPTLQVVAPQELWWPNAHALLVERMLSNMLDNAFKHGKPPVRMVLEGNDQQVRISVLDAGEGIAPADVQRLQEAFARGDSSRTTAGAGLGLAIVRQIAQRLGGSLHFSHDNQAHTVSIVLRR